MPVHRIGPVCVCGGGELTLHRFLGIYSECVAASHDRPAELSRCAARTGGDRCHRRSEHPVSQGNNNGRQPSLLSAPARCCRHWKVTDVAAAAPDASTSSGERRQIRMHLLAPLAACHSAPGSLSSSSDLLRYSRGEGGAMPQLQPNPLMKNAQLKRAVASCPACSTAAPCVHSFCQRLSVGCEFGACSK